MADCEGRLTGRPGICFVTRGPGATNASAGVHIAMQDSNPMILFIGQIASHAKEREAFQEVDYKRFFGDIAKWVVEIDDAKRIPELVTRAFAVATSGRPGPVVISLPEDMLTSEVEAPRRPAVYAGRNLARRARDAASWKSCSPRPSGPSPSSAARAGARRPSACSSARPKAGRCRSAAPSAARCCSTICTPAMPAMSASAPTRSLRRPSRKPTSCCWSAAAWAKCPRPTIRC